MFILKCREELISCPDPVLETSKTISEMCEDISSNPEYIPVPDKYYDVINCEISSIDTLIGRLYLDELIQTNPCAEIENINMEQILLEEYKIRCRKLKFYNMMNVAPASLKKLGYEIGLIIERKKFAMNLCPELMNIVVKYNTSLINIFEYVNMTTLSQSDILKLKLKYSKYGSSYYFKKNNKQLPALNNAGMPGNYELMKYTLNLQNNAPKYFWKAIDSNDIRILKLFTPFPDFVPAMTEKSFKLKYKAENVEIIKYLLSLTPSEELRTTLLVKSRFILDIDLFKLLFVEGNTIDLRLVYHGVLASSNVELYNYIINHEVLNISSDDIYKIIKYCHKEDLLHNCNEKFLNTFYNNFLDSMN